MEREKVWREFMELPSEDQRKVAEFITSLSEKPMNLEDEPFIGVWSDCGDLADSTAWVRGQCRRDAHMHPGDAMDSPR